MDFKTMDISEKERRELIAKLVEELPFLRTKLGMSQEELGLFLGVSRQTYSSIETKRRKMSWSLFLSLILIFDYDDQTHDYIRSSGLFPLKIFGEKTMDTARLPIGAFVKMDENTIREKLDEQAIHAIETVIMMEYARCNEMTGDAVIKAFDGKRMTQVTDKNILARRALANLKADMLMQKKQQQKKQ